jgi:hypothetical protein
VTRPVHAECRGNAAFRGWQQLNRSDFDDIYIAFDAQIATSLTGGTLVFSS